MRNKFENVSNVNIMDLQLDTQNPRLGELASQTECMAVMLDEMGKKIEYVAKHIGKYGLSPEHIVISPHESLEKTWIVRDGNRRITALKLLNNPELAPEKHRPRFRKIRDHADQTNIPKKINCVTSDLDTIHDYMELKHAGEQDGVGQVKWGPVEKDNFQETIGGKRQNDLAYSVVRYLTDNGVEEAEQAAITNVERFLKDSEVQKQIGFSYNDNQLNFTKDKAFVFTVLKEFILDFSIRKKTVSDIYNKEKVQIYLEELLANLPEIPTSAPSNSPTPSPKPPSALTTKPTPPSNTVRVKPPQQAPRRRRKLIQRNKGLPIPSTESKCLSLQYELSNTKGVDIIESPIAASVLLRLMLEFSVEYYIEQQGLETHPNTALWKKILACANHMKHAGKIDDSQYSVLQKTNKAEELISASTLNAYVHNSAYIPIPENLCTIWDNLYFFLYLCWKS